MHIVRVETIKSDDDAISTSCVACTKVLQVVSHGGAAVSVFAADGCPPRSRCRLGNRGCRLIHLSCPRKEGLYSCLIYRLEALEGLLIDLIDG